MAPRLVQLGQQVKIVDDSDQIVASFSRDPTGDSSLVPSGATPSIYDVKDAAYGAKGDGSTDDVAAIMAAINAAGPAGGGRILFRPGNYRLASLYGGNSLGALLIAYDNIHLELLPGARLYSELASQGALVVAGNAKPTSLLLSGATASANWYQYGSFFPISPVTAGDVTITCTHAADAGTFAAGDLLYLSSAEMISGNTPQQQEPDAEIVEVWSVNAGTGVITLREPVAKSYVQEYFPTPGTPTTTNAGVNPGDTVIPVASTAGPGFVAGDGVTIIGTGTNPSHRSVIQSVQAGVSITLRHAIEVAIPSGAAVHKGSGISTTGVTTALALMGVRKVTGYTINNFKISGGGKIENSFSTAQMIWMNQVRDFRIEDMVLSSRGLTVGGNNVTDGRIRRNTVRCVPNAGEGTYWLGLGTGSKNISAEHNDVRSGLFTGIVFSEGTYNGEAIDNVILCGKTGSNSDTPLAVQSRSHAQIGRNVVRGGGTDAIIFVGSNCTRGGSVYDNDVSGSNGKPMNIQPSGWRINGHLVVDLTYSASVTPNPEADLNQLTVTDAVAFTIANPSIRVKGLVFTLRIKNSSGGALGTITWGNEFRLAGGGAAFVKPGAFTSRLITFYYDGAEWVEINHSTSDT